MRTHVVKWFQVRWHRFVPTLLAMVAALALAGAALAGSSTAIGWQVVSGGGAPSASGVVALNDTLGQPVIGLSGSGGVVLGAGYWTGTYADEPPRVEVFLPVVVK